jgi:hypothetical protein
MRTAYKTSMLKQAGTTERERSDRFQGSLSVSLIEIGRFAPVLLLSVCRGLLLLIASY